MWPQSGELPILFFSKAQRRTAIPGREKQSNLSCSSYYPCLSLSFSTARKIPNTRISTITMQAVRDSMLVISVTPMFGIEIYRLEATPFEVIAFDKLQGRYARATYTDVNRKLTPSVNWDVLQQLCSAELPTGSDRARLLYSFGDDTIELIIDYTPRRLDVPVRMSALPLDRYTQEDISKWL